MFSSLGLFREIPCPKQTECELPSCIFQHTDSNITKLDEESILPSEYDPLTAGEPESPPRKKRRLDCSEEAPWITANRPAADPVSKISGSAQPTKTTQILKSEAEPLAQPRNSVAIQNASKSITQLEPRTTQKQIPVSTTRTVSPPPVRKVPQSVQASRTVSLFTEPLIPRNVPSAPATISTRLSVLKALHQQLIAQNEKLSKDDVKWKFLVLGEHELIRFALDEEEEHARKFATDIYRNAIAQRILRLKKMSTDEWRQEVGKKFGGGQSAQLQTTGTLDIAQKPISTGIASRRDEIAVLEELRTPLDGLDKYGYVVSKPSEHDITAARRADSASGGFETCDRCGTRFQVFPGRDEQGRLTSGGTCRYHWARLNKGQWSKTGRVTGDTSAAFPCCNRAPGSDGCTEADTHVFKVADIRRLASTLQFETTPNHTSHTHTQPLSFDCEMGYTTIGLELMRVTAVSWPDGKVCLDVLVRPYGEVLDFNTRFSGITANQYADTPAYQPTQTRPSGPQILTKVESVAAARGLLFEFINHNTPLIGHAIENDLNACRIIHPFVIDTVLLYPHPRGLPIRYGLKMLAQKYLTRSIQAGGDRGHDSKEDAVATGDLVTWKVAEKWRTMRLEGWKLTDGLLVSPETHASAKALL